MTYEKREIPWIRIVQFHEEIVRRAEEAFFALPAGENDSERWSSVAGFHPTSLSGPWSIPQKTIISQQLGRLIRGEGFSELFLGGPCWFEWRRGQGNQALLYWKPIIYREVRVELDSENGFRIIPEKGSWDISPLVFDFMEKKGIQPDKPLDKLLPDIIEKARLKSKKENKDLTDSLVEELGRAIPELGYELGKEFPNSKVESLPSPWILFAPHTTNIGYNKNLMRDYEQLVKQLENNPDQIGGLKLLEDLPVVKECLFSWNEIPGNDTAQLLEFLRHNYGVAWVRTAIIEKINDGNTISVSTENNSLLLRLNKEKDRANLTINDVRTDKFIVKNENGKLKIYTRVDILPMVTLDPSQDEAVTGILKSKPVTVISGPPGCGKSQVVFSTLLNAWAKGTSVLFASQNNQAVDVIHEKLKRFESDFPIAIRAGKKEKNNIEETFRRTLNIVAAGVKLTGMDDSSTTVKRYKEILSKKNRLLDILESQIPQRVDEALRSALSAYGKYQTAIHDLNDARELHIKEIKELGYEIAPDEFTDKISRPLRAWLEKIKEYHKRISQDSEDRSNFLKRAAGSADARNLAVQQAGLDPSSVNNWNWLISGPGYELIEAWLESYKSLLSKPLEEQIVPIDWYDEFDEWEGEVDARDWSLTGRQLVNDIRRTCGEVSPKIAEIKYLKNRFDEQSLIIMEAGIPDDIQVDSALFSEWITVYTTECSLPKGKFDWFPWSQRNKLVRKLQSIEAQIRPSYPLSIWRKIGEMNKTGRETLSEIIETSSNWIAVRNLWNEKKTVLEGIENRIEALRGKLTKLRINGVPNDTDLSNWLELAETIKEKTNVADEAAVAWNKKAIAEKTRERLLEIAKEFHSIASGIPLKEAWIKGPGHVFAQSVSTLAVNPTPDDIISARTALYSESIAVLLKAWHEARDAEMEFRAHTSAAGNISSESSRITEWWDEKPLYVSIQRTDYSTLPDSDGELWKHLKACEDRDAKWKLFIEKTLPDAQERCNEELNWAINLLKKAFETVPDGHDKIQIGQTVQPLLDGHEKIWPIDELFKLFERFRPAIIKGQIDAMDGQLEILSFNVAKDCWLRRIGNDIEAQKALEALLNHYRRNYDRIEGCSSTDLFTKALYAVPIWITTAQSPQSIPMQPEVFDLLVIDEATQCTLTNLLPMIYRARRIAVIGDPEQLPAIGTIGYEAEKSLAAKFDITEWLELLGHAGNDVYKSAVHCLPRRHTDVISLVRHYRSHPLIIGFANQHIYQKKLLLRKDPTQARKVPFGAGVHGNQVNGYCTRGARGESWINHPEKEAVCELVKQLRAMEGFGAITIGIVTPFKAHADAISEKLDRLELTRGVTVGTAHKYQGDERDVMIFSPVVAKGITDGAARWVENPHNLINVAVTRAREALFVVGDLKYCGQQDGILGKLVKYVETVSDLRKTSPYELELFSWMVMEGWNPEVHVQVGDIEVDFILIHHGIRLVIEVDGETVIKPDGEIIETHVNESAKDASRDAFLMGRGYDVLHVKTRSIRETPRDVLHDIAKALKLDWADNIIE